MFTAIAGFTATYVKSVKRAAEIGWAFSVLPLMFKGYEDGGEKSDIKTVEHEIPHLVS